MNYTGQTGFAEMFEYYCTRNVTNEREYNEREMMRWAKDRIQQAHREADSSAKNAFRRGWEQGKRECIEIVQNYEYDTDRDGDFADQLDEVIAAMEYKEKAND